MSEPVVAAVEATVVSVDLVEAGPLAFPANRSPAGRFVPGHSGNPSGRPKSAGLAALIKDKTQDGAELVDIALKILRSRREETRYRLEALAFLADRGWGKPIQAHEVTGEGGGEVVFRLALGERATE